MNHFVQTNQLLSLSERVGEDLNHVGFSNFANNPDYSEEHGCSAIDSAPIQLPNLELGMPTPRTPRNSKTRATVADHVSSALRPSSSRSGTEKPKKAQKGQKQPASKSDTPMFLNPPRRQKTEEEESPAAETKQPETEAQDAQHSEDLDENLCDLDTDDQIWVERHPTPKYIPESEHNDLRHFIKDMLKGHAHPEFGEFLSVAQGDGEIRLIYRRPTVVTPAASGNPDKKDVPTNPMPSTSSASEPSNPAPSASSAPEPANQNQGQPPAAAAAPAPQRKQKFETLIIELISSTEVQSIVLRGKVQQEMKLSSAYIRKYPLDAAKEYFKYRGFVFPSKFTAARVKRT
ncbi:hypothetical protein 2 [Hubei dimarhabdovirus virus 3]|uniref:hypothetical protein 2 n=1 Tax=Hubei dimarhabdovirus virus 3 TaxID=1922868 RepID=UPI00090BD803|nr:hypothetical protein 2 [Hubei dimarhabdovirus virus 3]APG78712.1 hypothetical protein 2 [Hubei dimarhabdovirus virus 3]